MLEVRRWSVTASKNSAVNFVFELISILLKATCIQVRFKLLDVPVKSEKAIFSLPSFSNSLQI